MVFTGSTGLHAMKSLNSKGTEHTSSNQHRPCFAVAAQHADVKGAPLLSVERRIYFFFREESSGCEGGKRFSLAGVHGVLFDHCQGIWSEGSALMGFRCVNSLGTQWWRAITQRLLWRGLT